MWFHNGFLLRSNQVLELQLNAKLLIREGFHVKKSKTIQDSLRHREESNRSWIMAHATRLVTEKTISVSNRVGLELATSITDKIAIFVNVCIVSCTRV